MEATPPTVVAVGFLDGPSSLWSSFRCVEGSGGGPAGPPAVCVRWVGVQSDFFRQTLGWVLSLTVAYSGTWGGVGPGVFLLREESMTPRCPMRNASAIARGTSASASTTAARRSWTSALISCS